MIKVEKFEFESEDYIKHLSSPYYICDYKKENASKLKKDVYVILISKSFNFFVYPEEIKETYSEILKKMKKVFNLMDNFYFEISTTYKKETKLTNYFRLWNELKRRGVDLSFFNKTQCSDEIKYNYPNNKVVYRALCQFQWQNIEEYFFQNIKLYDRIFTYFFLSKRKFNLNTELKKLIEEHKDKIEFKGNNVFSLEYCMDYFIKNDDLFFIVHGDSEAKRTYGINIIGNKKMIDELYEKVLKCFENEK